MHKTSSHSRFFSHWFTILLFTSLYIKTVTSDRKQGDCIRVHPHGSIQDAINHAHPGERIEIEGGIYNEQLTINKSGIHIIGKNGATLRPPNTFYANPCSGLSRTFDNKSTEAGICIHGNVDLLPYIAEHRKLASLNSSIDNVSIRGLTIDGFTGENIAILGGRNTRIKSTTLVNGGQYGVLSVGSTHTRVTHNTVSSTKLDFIGISADDAAGMVVAHNDVTGYVTAYVSETDGGVITENRAANICVGAAADPGVNRSVITSNFISFRNPGCNANFPQFSAGVVVFGARETLVERNTIEKIRNGGFGVGIFLLLGTAGELAERNVVKNNLLRENDVDVYDNSSLPNAIAGNRCLSTGVPSFPQSACA